MVSRVGARRTSYLFLALAGIHSTAGNHHCKDLKNAIGVDNIVTREDKNYNDARVQFASSLGSSELSDSVTSPEAIVYAHSNQDLQDILKFAHHCQYKLHVRSGGHQYSGYSSCHADEKRCIQVDMSAFQEFEVNDYIVKVGVGMRLGTMNELIQPYNLTIPFGVCDSVGVGGHYQSSSVGVLARAFGLGMDHVVSFRILTADGTLHTVTKESDTALYNGVLGGGPGNFGIILHYTFEALKSEDYPHMHTFFWTWPYTNQRFQDVMQVYTDIMRMPEINRDLFLYASVTNPRDLRDAGDVSVWRRTKPESLISVSNLSLFLLVDGIPCRTNNWSLVRY